VKRKYKLREKSFNKKYPKLFPEEENEKSFVICSSDRSRCAEHDFERLRWFCARRN
jgi:hypothetical protein